MNAEQILMRLAEARKRVKYVPSNGLVFIGESAELCEFDDALCDAIKLGEELRPKGKWVDFDPSKFTCDQFPIKGRVSDNVMGWIDAVVSGYNHTNSYRFIVVNNHHNFKNFQIWEAEE